MKHYEDHPFVTELKRYAGSDDDEIIAQTARTNFATFDQSSRTQLLIETEKLVGADERASRQNAQLLNLSRELRNLVVPPSRLRLPLGLFRFLRMAAIKSAF